ncbi:hypothetical protein DVH24_016857 [Malus domestica]|uniref:CRAL-TRIO domain-containing protein n=1 Tax=Malus domestica TaxID=3750 RepID=A0A498HWT1_MALDO|nr:hypothetical protein DVH24_016857 [Malus domestica]
MLGLLVGIGISIRVGNFEFNWIKNWVLGFEGNHESSSTTFLEIRFSLYVFTYEMGSRGKLLFDLNEPPAEDNEESDSALSFQPQKALPCTNPNTTEVLAVAAVAPRIVNNHAFSHASSVSGFQPFVRPKYAHGSEGDADEKSRDSNPRNTLVSESSNDEDMKPVPSLASASANAPSLEREEGEWSDDAEGSAEAGGSGSLHEQGTTLQVQGKSGGIVGRVSGVAPDSSSCDIKTSEGLKDENSSRTSLGVDNDQNSNSSRNSDGNFKGQASMDCQDEPGLVLKQDKVKGIEATHALKCANNPMKRKMNQQNEAKLGKKRNRQTMFLNLDDVKQAGTVKSSTPRRQNFPTPVTTRTLKEVRTITAPADRNGEKQSQLMIKDQKQVDVLCNGGTAAESSDSKFESNGDVNYGSLSRTRRQNGDNDPSAEVLPLIPRQSSWKQPTDTRQLKNSQVANRKPALITQSSMDSKSGNKKLLLAKKQTTVSNTYQDTSVERLIREVTNEKIWHHPGETDLQCVTEKFESVEEYVRVFEPLLFEECRAQLYSTWEELTEGVSRDAHITVRVRSIERRERGWYDVIVLPVSECKWTFKEGDVAILSTPRPGSVRSKRNNSSAEGDEEPEITGRVAGTVRRHMPIDTRDPPGAILHFYVGDDSNSLVDDEHVLRKLQPKGIWYLTVLGSLATTQREYVALHAFRRLNMQMQAAILRPSPEHFPKYEQQSPAMPECFTPNFVDHLHRTFNGPQLSAIQWAAMHTAAGTSGGKRQDPWPFTLVQGPPGTGKTHTVWGMLNVIHLVQYQQYYTSLLKKLAPESYKQNSESNVDNVATGSIDEVLQNMDQNLLRTLPKLCPKPRMLVCAPSNAATDELLARVLDRGFIDGEMKVYRPDVARVGVDSQTRAAQAVSVERRTEQLLVKNREEVMGNASALMQCDDWAALITDAKARNCFMDIETLPKEFRVPRVPSYAQLPGKPSNMRGFRSAGPRHRSMDMHKESRSGTPAEDDEKLGASVVSRNGSYRPMKPPFENSLDDFDQSGDKSRDAWQYGIQKKHGPAGLPEEFGSKGGLAGAVGLCVKLLLQTIHHLTIFRDDKWVMKIQSRPAVSLKPEKHMFLDIQTDVEFSSKIMSAGMKKSPSNGSEKILSCEEQQAKINEVKKLIGTLPDKLSIYCSDASISRYLRARNWNVKKATKMLKDTLRWRSEYKPEEIPWNSKSTKGQIKYLVYCMENAVLNLPPGQEQMVWMIDFEGFNMSHISVKVTRETAHVLQNRYPERLGLAILYNPPKFFEPFFSMVKPFLEPKTCNKVRFVYSDDVNTKKIMEDLFDMNKLEAVFGGNDTSGFDINKYAERMKEDDKKMPTMWTRGNPSLAASEPAVTGAALSLDSLKLEPDSDASDNEKTDGSSSQGIEPEVASDHDEPVAASTGNATQGVH